MNTAIVDIAERARHKTRPYKLAAMNGLNQYDFGARQQDPALGIFTSPDPMAEKYPSISPYAYCAGNPILYTDPIGMDYSVSINEENKKIIISANYYTSNEDMESARNAAEFWNNQSDNIDGYEVSFNLNVIEAKSEDLEKFVKDDKSGTANSFAVNADTENILSDSKISGTTVEGKNIYINPKLQISTTGAHEMGHTIGLDHWAYGIMTENGNNKLRNEPLPPFTIETIIDNAKEKNYQPGLGKGFIIK